MTFSKSELSRSEFDQYASQGFNRIPLMREVLADLDTPLSVYLKLARDDDGNRRYSYLFESVQGSEKWGRYSMIVLPCRPVLRVTDNAVSVERDGVLVEETEEDDPLAFVEQFADRYSVPEIEGLPRFTGGLVGYFGYETIRYIEPTLGEMKKPDVIGTPDILLMVSDEVVVFTRQLATMTGAGITIVSSLDTLAEQALSVAFKKVLRNVRDRKSGG